MLYYDCLVGVSTKAEQSGLFHPVVEEGSEVHFEEERLLSKQQTQVYLRFCQEEVVDLSRRSGWRCREGLQQRSRRD